MLMHLYPEFYLSDSNEITFSSSYVPDTKGMLVRIVSALQLLRCVKGYYSLCGGTGKGLPDVEEGGEGQLSPIEG